MSIQRIASRYAKSLIDLAQELNKLDEVKRDMDGFKKALESRDLYLLLKSPIVSSEKKTEIVKAIFDGKLGELTMNFILLLVKKGREPYLPEVVTEFLEQNKKLDHITTIKITTAEKVDAAALEAIKAEFLKSVNTDDNIEVETAIDASLIGGFVVEFGDRMYDASVKHKLAKLKKEFVGNVYTSQVKAR
jgi:F-type H+-transporting ATPase subunit delta